MAETNGIIWCDHTLNFWIGCQKVSPACDGCYAEAWANRWPRYAGAWSGERYRTGAANWHQAVRWNREARSAGVRRRVFSNSLSDFFDNQVSPGWRGAAWSLIEDCDALDFMILTKRPQNIEKMLPIRKAWHDRCPWPNVWLGTTAENQEEADRRIPHLLTAPAAKHFVSAEPLLSGLDLTRICLLPKRPGSIRAGVHINALTGRYAESGMPYVGAWDVNGPAPVDQTPRRLSLVIAGGESGAHARPSHPEWFRSLRDQCQSAGVPFHFKQWGEWAPHTAAVTQEDGTIKTTPKDSLGWRAHVAGGIDGMFRVGKKAAGRLLDGREHNEMPDAR